MVHLTHTILRILITLVAIFVPSVLSQLYGSCGTSAADSFTHNTDSVPFCFKFQNAYNPSNNGLMFYYFATNVDTYTLVTLQGSNLGESYDDNTTTDYQWMQTNAGLPADVGVQFEAGNVTSNTVFARYTDENDRTWIYTQMSLVIVLDNGKVDEVLWDKGCTGCDAENCIKNNCAIPVSECNVNNCDMSAYISWYGTDSGGRYLLSAGQRLSQFQSASARSYYDYVKENVETQKKSFE
eukprot:CAMPEP_0197027052 /NCGR_PEP_ID=MMETSP1384-20130603/7042_1 /TAXON_ID=29189 /ORGANISM="Ammonia sp." /LENGTH=238 /DNA_ID=CAMNT_0042455843 /DNA_START=39 /DNA_END=755 /DNA_ORIENTATION=+